MSVFITAGWDKLQSKNWMSGTAFLIWMSLPQFRLFKLSTRMKPLLIPISKILCKVEIFQQFILPIGVLLFLLFGNTLLLNLFMGLGFVFLSSLIYPFNLNPIGIWGLFILSLTLVLSNSVSGYLYFLLPILTTALCFLLFKNPFNLSNIIRTSLGVMRCGLFSEYHLHGLLILNDSSSINKFRSSFPNDRMKFSRVFVNNQSWICILRLLDVLERYKFQRQLKPSDLVFLRELKSLFTTHHSYTFKLTQLSWVYSKSSFDTADFHITVYDDDSMTLQSLSESVLPFKTKRNSVDKGKYGEEFSPQNALHGCLHD